MYARRTSRATATLREAAFLVALVMLTANPVLAQNEVSLGLDAALQQDAGSSVELSPWLSTALSLYGYPTGALSWFADAAGRAEYLSSDQAGVFSGTANAGASLRRGLSILRMDAAAGSVIYTGGAPASLDAAVRLGASTGSAVYALYAETEGGIAYSEPDRTLFGRGQLGGSVTIGAAVAPDLALTGLYRGFDGGDSQTTVGMDLSLPWYPPRDFTATLGFGALRSFGTAEYFVGDDRYLPDRYWELSWDGSVSISLSRRVAVDVMVPGYLQFYTEHGPLVGGSMQSGTEWVVSMSPAISASFDLSDFLVLEGELGAELSRSNSPYRAASSGYLTAALRYRF